MIDYKKKYLSQSKDSYPHIGQMLENYIDENKINKSDLSRGLGINRKGITEYLENESLQIGVLWKLSLVMQHNFIATLAEAFPIAQPTKRELELESQLLENQTILSKLEMELAVYKRIVDGK